MSEFPDPARFVAANIAQCIVVFDRRDRKGRAAGTRLVEFEDQAGRGRRVARQWESLDSVHTSPWGDQYSLYDLASGRDNGDGSLEQVVIDRVDAERLVDRLADGVSADELRFVELVDGYDLEVQDVAKSAGVARETMSRKVNRTRQTLRERADELVLSGTSEGGTT